MADPSNGRGALAAGGLAAILASTCCLGPLVLITLGFSGAWIGNLTALEPYRPIFIGVALVALFFAWRRIFRPARVLPRLCPQGTTLLSMSIAASSRWMGRRFRRNAWRFWAVTRKRMAW